MAEGKPAPTVRDRVQRRAALIVLLLLGVWLASRFVHEPLLPVGTEAPPWRLPLANGSGTSLSLEELRGSVVVLDFWSTTCGPCRRQMAEIEAAMLEIDRLGAVVVGVAAGGETVAEVEEFLTRKALPYRQVVDGGATSIAYKVATLPSLYVIDKAGRVSDSNVGIWSAERLLGAVRAAAQGAGM